MWALKHKQNKGLKLDFVNFCLIQISRKYDLPRIHYIAEQRAMKWTISPICFTYYNCKNKTMKFLLQMQYT